MERLRKLDARVKNAPVVTALCLGIVGCLIFGLGLTMILEWKEVFWGVVLCAVGALPMLIAYPAYKGVSGRYREKYGEEIVKISEELLSGEEKEE